MNTEILNCQKYLQPDQPTEVTSEDIKPYLKELGWQEGDMIPGGMPTYTTEVLKVLGKPVAMRNIQYFFEDETVQATLRSAIVKTKMFIEDRAKIDEKVKELVPNIDNIHEAAKDTIVKLAEKAAKEEAESKATSTILEEKDNDAEDTIDGLEDISTDDDDVSKDPLELHEHDTPIQTDDYKPICPRCLWNLADPYVPYPVTEADKIEFAYSVLGGTDFIKKYVTAHDLLEITYKAPSAYVSRMIEHQLKIDEIKGRNPDYSESYVNATRYGLAASLYSVKALRGVDSNPPIPDLFDEQFKSDTDDTNIYLFTRYIEENVIKSVVREAFFRETYSEFLHLQVQLQKTIDSENFFDQVLENQS